MNDRNRMKNLLAREELSYPEWSELRRIVERNVFSEREWAALRDWCRDVQVARASHSEACLEFEFHRRSTT